MGVMDAEAEPEIASLAGNVCMLTKVNDYVTQALLFNILQHTREKKYDCH